MESTIQVWGCRGLGSRVVGICKYPKFVMKVHGQ